MFCFLYLSIYIYLYLSVFWERSKMSKSRSLLVSSCLLPSPCFLLFGQLPLVPHEFWLANKLQDVHKQFLRNIVLQGAWNRNDSQPWVSVKVANCCLSQSGKERDSTLLDPASSGESPGLQVNQEVYWIKPYQPLFESLK